MSNESERVITSVPQAAELAAGVAAVATHIRTPAAVREVLAAGLDRLLIAAPASGRAAWKGVFAAVACGWDDGHLMAEALAQVDRIAGEVARLGASLRGRGASGVIAVTMCLVFVAIARHSVEQRLQVLGDAPAASLPAENAATAAETAGGGAAGDGAGATVAIEPAHVGGDGR